MTSIGLKLLNIFSRFLHDDTLLKKKKLTERDIYIVSKLYNWEEPEPDIRSVLASELNISTERVRQIGVKALKKLRRPIYSDPVGEMRKIISSYASPTEKDDLLKTVVRLCLYEMNGLPTMQMVNLLICLCISYNEGKLSAMISYCKSHKKALEQEDRYQQKLARIKSRRDRQLANFLDAHVLWFDKVKSWEKRLFAGKEPKRLVVADPRYQSGTFYSHKMKRNVQYESGAELHFIERLEAADIVEYYLEQPVTIKYQKNNKEQIYTPDFAVLLNNGSCFLTEIKGNFEDLLDSRLHRDVEQLISFCKQHGFGMLVACGLRSFDYWTNCPLNTDLEKIIQNKLNERGGRTIFLNEFKAILELTGALKKDVLALVWSNNWGFYPFPFKLTPRNPCLVFRETITSKYFQNDAP